MADPVSLLEKARTIAVVGCSRHDHKAAHRIPRILQASGFRVVPVNPHTDTCLGEATYPSLAEIPDDVEIDIVDVFRPAAEAPEVARQAVEVGAGAVWLQAGITSAEARQVAESGGLAFVEDECAGALVRSRGIRAPDGHRP